eukprot:Phypoly_transcript_09043.p1 GENE.Phypoly_transcript_09043~~Phypoly_transcript_09043.p1  ORF type:complete len:171 (+),score=21.11 Phypoly_transcript_09043:847-1359(+)
MITNTQGNDCAFLGSPYINNCNYDAAGTLLNFIYGSLKSPGTPIASNIITLSQAQFIPNDKGSIAGFAENAYLYVPTNCSIGGCRLHIVFHGCLQTVANINTTFVTDAGYNGWAESNNIVILYPQIEANSLVNPNGCWDWWGYTGPTYATQLGVQMKTVKNMAEYVLSKY